MGFEKMGLCLCFGGKNHKGLIESRNEDDNQQPAPNIKTSDNNSSSVSRDDFPTKRIVQMFSYKELEIATDNFNSQFIIEEGSFGRVFKGILKASELVAVKVLNPNSVQGGKEWLMEVLMLHRLNHPNLINLIGCCIEGVNHLLVYEFMPSGSLKQYLYGSEMASIDWNTRMVIADGVAKALNYLHNEAQPPVIYRGLKPENILLGEGFKPKVSDFGIAMFVTDDQDNSRSKMGKGAYSAPEHEVTTKLDVYSFGGILLELVTGLRKLDVHGEKCYLADWMHNKLTDSNDYVSLADPRMNGEFPEGIFREVIKMCVKCTEDDPKQRPSMKDVARAMDSFKSRELKDLIRLRI